MNQATTDKAEDMPAAQSSPKPSPRGPRHTGRVVLRWIKRGIAVLVILGVVGLLVFAWMPKPIPVDMHEVARGPMEVTVDEDGRARVRDRYVVSAPLNGRLARIELDPGDGVKAGDVLARIVPLEPPLLDPRSKSTAEAQVAASLAAKKQIGAQIERAKATLEFAKTQAKRSRELRAKKAVSAQELEQALLAERTAAAELESLRFGSSVADHELRMARATLERKKGDGEQLEVPSPVDGRVLKVIQESEGVVQAGTPLLELGDPSALEIVVDVLTSDAVSIQPGAKTRIDRWGGDSLSARVRMIEPSAFTRLSALGVEEQRVNVVIDLDASEADWEKLGDGYRVEAHIVVWESPDVVRIPASAVFRHDGGWAVYRVDAGVARLTPVRIDHRNGREVEIAEGIEPPAKVVVHPGDRIVDGVEVVSR